MGCCCSCGNDEEETAARETELAAQQSAQSLVVSAKMSAPTVKIVEGTVLSGRGMALVGTPLEQDAAYWEWLVSLPARKHVDTILFGVASKKDRTFYHQLDGKESAEGGESSEELGTEWMRQVEVQDGDVVGVAVQQSDLPMLQFFHNGEPLYDISINRFRGTVYPAICLPKSEEDVLKVTAVLAETNFHHMSPAAKFGPIIVARSIV